jgi:ATP-dependent DNA helicase RecG
MAFDPVLEYAETLTAFANGRGGSFTIATTQPEDLLEIILQAALRSSPPLVIPMPQIQRGRNRANVHVTIPPGLPHVYSVEGRYLIREGDKNIPLLPARLRRLLLERGEITFEDEIVYAAQETDLDWDAIEQYAERLGATNPKELLIRRGCLRMVADTLYPTQAGILLFGRDPLRFIRGAFITAARFAGVEMGDVFTRMEISGALPAQIRQAETFLIDHLRKDVQLTGAMERRERYELPLEAAREALVNAVAHRDYSIQGDGIRLYLFADRLEVTSPGKLPGPVTLSNLVEERFSRNSIIVQVLADMGFIERLGYGIDRILSLFQEHSLPAPAFDETNGGFRITLFNNELTSTTMVDMAGLNPRQQRALEFLAREGTITNRQYQELCPDVHSETLRRDLADLVARELIMRLGEKRGSYYVLVKK